MTDAAIVALSLALAACCLACAAAVVLVAWKLPKSEGQLIGDMTQNYLAAYERGAMAERDRQARLAWVRPEGAGGLVTTEEGPTGGEQEEPVNHSEVIGTNG